MTTEEQLHALSEKTSKVASLVHRLWRNEHSRTRTEASFSLLPSIRFVDNDVYCNGMIIPTEKKNLTQELFRIFIDSGKKSLSRDEMMNIIYESNSEFSHSMRYYESASHNMVKLISRARSLANSYTNVHGYRWIDWFCYCPERQEWTFFNLTYQYIKDKEVQLAEYLDHIMSKPKLEN